MPERHDRLSDSDSLIRRIEGDPVLRSPILVVGLLDRAPTASRVGPSLQRAVDAIPRFRQRVVQPAPWARPRWIDDDHFSLEHHVRHVRAPRAGGIEAALEVAAPDAAAAFDPARSPWELTLVDGLADGRSAFVLRFHHTVTDGVGGVGLAEQFFEPTRRGRRDRSAAVVAAPPLDVPRPTPLDLAARSAAGAVRAALDPAGTIRQGRRVVRSVAKMLAPARAPLSPILVGRGLDRHLDVLEVPLPELQRVAKRTGGTVNDVFLAAVAGGLRDYHERMGAPVEALRITMPISLRTDDDAPGGNHFTPARFVLPIAELDPVRRIAEIGAIVRGWRAEPAVALTPLLATALSLLPDPVVQRAFAGMLRAMDVDAVDVPGLRAPAYLAGARVDRLWAFAPPTGAALSITLVSHLDHGCVGIAADAAAVRDPAVLAHCLQVALDEVLAVGASTTVTGVPA